MENTSKFLQTVFFRLPDKKRYNTAKISELFCGISVKHSIEHIVNRLLWLIKKEPKEGR